MSAFTVPTALPVAPLLLRPSVQCRPRVQVVPSCSNQDVPSPSRRALLTVLATIPLAPFLSRRAQAVNGLHIFPLREPLVNTYYLMRACETQTDAKHITASNPVDKLSISKHGLTARGVDAALAAADAMLASGLSDNTWIWPSVTTSAFETAEVLASRLQVRRDRIVPEFSFLDMRGLGALDGNATSDVAAELARHDAENPDWRPPPNDDGTPNDSAQDVFVRVRQLLSKLETQYFGADIVVIAPDSDALSIWQAAVSGIDLRAHNSLAFRPGEVRRVEELVADAYGRVVQPPAAHKVFRPV